MQLKADNLVCNRGGREVFAGLSFSLSAGEALVVTGRNGASGPAPGPRRLRARETWYGPARLALSPAEPLGGGRYAELDPAGIPIEYRRGLSL